MAAGKNQRQAATSYLHSYSMDALSNNARKSRHIPQLALQHPALLFFKINRSFWETGLDTGVL